MSPRPFLCVPGDAWLRDPALNGCHEDAIALFHVIAESSDRHWRIEVATASHSFSVRQCFRDPSRFRRWSEQRIDRALAELRARGCLLFATANDREYLEIPDRLCYKKGDRPEAALSPPVQQPLPLPGGEPTLFLVGESRAPAARPAPHWNEKRVRVRKEPDRESEAPREPAPPLDALGTQARRELTRELSPGGDSDSPRPSPPPLVHGPPPRPMRFARSADDFACELGQWLGRTIGMRQWTQELIASGAMWHKWLRERPRDLREALEEWNAKTPEERAVKGGNAAAFLCAVMKESERRSA